MTLKGILTTILITIFIGGISIFLGPPIALIILGLFYVVLGVIYMVNKENYIKITKFINIDKYNAYMKKDKNFKEYIKDNGISMIIIGLVLFYFSYRWFNAELSFGYNYLIIFFVLGNYFIETYSMIKSKSWEDYIKKSGMCFLVLIALIILFL